MEGKSSNENLELFHSLICDDCKSESKLACDHTTDKQNEIDPMTSMSKAEKIKRLIPIENYYSPIIPFTLSHKLVERYNAIFGDHSCDKCEHVEQKDYLTPNIFSFNICKTNYINLHIINVSLRAENKA